MREVEGEQLRLMKFRSAGAHYTISARGGESLLAGDPEQSQRGREIDREKQLYMHQHKYILAGYNGAKTKEAIDKSMNADK